MSKRRKFGLSEGLLIASAPALAYIFAFSFETGYAKYFGIPYDFIVMDLTNVLIVGGALTSVLLLLMNLSKLLPARTTRIVFWRFIFPSLFGILTWAFLSSELALWWKVPFPLLFIFFLWGDVIYPIFKYKGSWLDRWEAETDREQNAQGTFISGSLLGKGLIKLSEVGVDINIVIGLYWFLAFGIIISNVGGLVHASTQKSFLIQPSQRDVLIVRRWGDNFVGVAYDSSTNAISLKFHLISAKPNSVLALSAKEIRNLKGPSKEKIAENEESIVKEQMIEIDTRSVRNDSMH